MLSLVNGSQFRISTRIVTLLYFSLPDRHWSKRWPLLETLSRLSSRPCTKRFDCWCFVYSMTKSILGPSYISRGCWNWRDDHRNFALVPICRWWRKWRRWGRTRRRIRPFSIRHSRSPRMDSRRKSSKGYASKQETFARFWSEVRVTRPGLLVRSILFTHLCCQRKSVHKPL